MQAKTKGKDKFECRWETGIWLGVKDETGEAVIGTGVGVVRARDRRRFDEVSERWNAERTMKVVGTP